jgi:hypothetical protein
MMAGANHALPAIFSFRVGRVTEKKEGRTWPITEVNFFANGIGISYDGGHKVDTDSLRRISLICRYLSRFTETPHLVTEASVPKDSKLFQAISVFAYSVSIGLYPALVFDSKYCIESFITTTLELEIPGENA